MTFFTCLLKSLWSSLVWISKADLCEANWGGRRLLCHKIVYALYWKVVTVLWVGELLLTLLIKDCCWIFQAKTFPAITEKPITKQSEGLFTWRTKTATLKFIIMRTERHRHAKWGLLLFKGAQAWITYMPVCLSEQTCPIVNFWLCDGGTSTLSWTECQYLKP